MSRGGFTQIDNATIDQIAKEVGTNAAWVYTYLLSWRIQSTGIASVTYLDIIATTGLVRSTVANAMRRLTDTGWIISLHRTGIAGQYTFPHLSSSKIGRVEDNIEESSSKIEPHQYEIQTGTSSKFIPPPVRNSYRSNTSPNTTINTIQDGEIAPKTARKRDPLWDALVEVMGNGPETAGERGKWNKAAKEIRDAGATPEQIHDRSANYRERWPDLTLTPMALAMHWGLLATPVPQGKVLSKSALKYQQTARAIAEFASKQEVVDGEASVLQRDGTAQRRVRPGNRTKTARNVLGSGEEPQ